MDKDRVARAIQRAMQDRGLSDGELAVLAGVTRRAICNYRHGDRLPRLDVGLKIGKILSIEWGKYLEKSA